MIQGSKKITLTPDAVLSKISSFDIFVMYMPQKNWHVNDVTISPFRKETHPSFLIGNRSGLLSFIDFGDTSKKGDCFTFVKMLYDLDSMDAVLKLIDKDFSLGIASGIYTGEYKKIVSEYKQPENLGKRYSLVQVKTRKFTNLELAYWNEYHQDISDLKREHIYSVDKVFLNKQLFPLKDTELRFGYFYEGNWKIYKPHSPKKTKWVPNNVPINYLEGKENIQNCDVALITKSKKDKMVIRKVFPCVCAVQNEGIACFPEDNIEFLKANSKKQILLFDSDEAGVTNSQQITQIFDFEYCNVPKSYLSEGINDYAELGRIHGLSKLEQQFKEKGIL
jgi:DNA primase